jgi:RNA polymerase primary sigma factor
MTDDNDGSTEDTGLTKRARMICIEALCKAFGSEHTLSIDRIVSVCRSIGLDADEYLIRSMMEIQRPEHHVSAPAEQAGAAPALPITQQECQTADAPESEAAAGVDGESLLAGAVSVARPLYAWQAEALKAWRQQDFRGIVEAVTGSGKTTVGIEVARDAIHAGGKVQVLVPTVALQEQWHRCLKASLPNHTVGLIGGGRGLGSGLQNNDAVVVVVNTGRYLETGDLPAASLLIGDECHRYGTDFNAQALNPCFPRRLGLTATSERRDDGNEEHVYPYFGSICYRLAYAQALTENVTAHFRVALVGLAFATWGEKADYERIVEQQGEHRKWLKENEWASSSSSEQFYTDVFSLAGSIVRRQGIGDSMVAVHKAKLFVNCFHRKRDLVGETPSKRHALIKLRPAIKEAQRVLVFTETIAASNHAAECLISQDIAAAAVNSKMTPRDRRDHLERFSSGEFKVLAAPRILDEGIDIPDADLAIVFCGTKTRRQMVQRMGRVLRRKPDGRIARFVVLYVQGTHEDPARGAYSDFIEEIVKVADTTINRPLYPDLDEIVEFLNDFRNLEGQCPSRMA